MAKKILARAVEESDDLEPYKTCDLSSVSSSTSSSPETRQEGAELYLQFLQSQMSEWQHSHSSLLSFLSHSCWPSAGRELRALTDALARSSARQEVRRQARQVDLRTLDVDNFKELVQHVFNEGRVSRERVVVLFFFCSDLALRALNEGMDHLMNKLTLWTISYIQDQVCTWVESQGGWMRVLDSGLSTLQRLALTAASLGVVVACCIYIRRNWATKT